MRSRWSRSDGSHRVASTRRSRSGAWSSSLSRSRSTAASVTSWKSSSTSTMGCWSDSSSATRAGRKASPLPRRGAALAEMVASARWSAATTSVQKRRRELASGPSPSHASRCPGSRASAQLDSRAVLPEPAGAAITVSGRSMARASFSARRGRSTIPGGMGGATSFVARTSSRSVGSAVASPSSKGVRLGSLSGSADRIKVARRFHPFRVMSDHPPPRDADRVNGTAATSKG